MFAPRKHWKNYLVAVSGWWWTGCNGWYSAVPRAALISAHTRAGSWVGEVNIDTEDGSAVTVSVLDCFKNGDGGFSPLWKHIW